MVQQGQTIDLTRRGLGGERLWAYRYRTGGRDSKRVQRGGFASEQDARDALERELERLRRERRITRRLTLSQFVETYLDKHLRHLRAPCRTLNLRPLSLHGSQPDHDRPPLRPPRPRRTRARNQPPRRIERARPQRVDAGGRS